MMHWHVLRQRRGSATLEVGFVSLINTDRNWELEFTPQSTANMESRKVRPSCVLEPLCMYKH